MKGDNSVVIRVAPEFRQKMKMKAVENDMSVLKLSKELGRDIKRGLKHNEDFFSF